MSKEVILFSKEELTFKYKFYSLMDLLITNQSSSRIEAIIMISVFYIQIISSFYDQQLKIFDGNSSFIDSILNNIKKIIRLKDLFRNSYSNFVIFKIAIFILIIICLVHFLIICLTMTRKSIYNFNTILINLYLKLFLYIFYNVIFDLCFSNFCLGKDNNNPNFINVSCSINDHILTFIVSVLLIIISFLLHTFINIYYSDCFYLNNSYYAKMSCNYDLYIGLNSVIHSFLLNQSKYLTKEIFIIYNVIISIILLIFYTNHFLYYERITNLLVGIYHMIYVWTSIFCLIFNFIKFGEKGIIYIITTILAIHLYISMLKKN